MTQEELKKIAIETAVERIVGNTPLSARHLVKLISDFQKLQEEHKKERVAWEDFDQKRLEQMAEMEELIGDALLEIQYAHDIPVPKDGRDADEELIVERVLERIPVPENGKDAVIDYDFILSQIPKPKDGADGISVDEERVIRKILKKIPKAKDGESVSVDDVYEELKKRKLKIEHIDGLRQEVDSYRHQMAMKQAGQHGGGDTVRAGTGITITRNTDGTTTITAAGAGTSVTTQYSLTAVQAGSNVTIALSQLTNFATFVGVIAVYRNNIMQTSGVDCTIGATSVTVNNADAGEVFNITYSYT